ncbi:FAD/NAD(P)-binding protein [Roseibacterium sp. SDUM158016]|uniref:FAD/NAD(P)-binding protein n=1 Tax=Roseicyclus sediminis TaxID=2980997 RepID=UPI0021CE0CCC|nr:FAD/NAD(P)-binding protein [Roseibacterium sp. SDUM158016]MCU4653945.1 FAD/NAD(P)-binding protein [Roseibacterium sp. SDUM158016]
MAHPAEPLPQDGMLPGVGRVLSCRTEAPDVVTHRIAWDGWEGCAPGQFNMLGLPGLGEVPISVSGGTRTPGEVLHTIRAVGPVSRGLAALKPGAALTMRGPYGRGWPVEAADGAQVTIVAGGLGLAPLRPVIRHFAETARARRVRLVIGARSPADLGFLQDYDDWRGAGIDLALTVDHAPPGWPGRVGVVTDLISAGPGRTVAYVCGPEIMMRVSAMRLQALGVDAGDIFLSLERNMKCGAGLCGHCQLGPVLLCRDGPVLDWARARPLMMVEDL